MLTELFLQKGDLLPKFGVLDGEDRGIRVVLGLWEGVVELGGSLSVPPDRVVKNSTFRMNGRFDGRFRGSEGDGWAVVS